MYDGDIGKYGLTAVHKVVASNPRPIIKNESSGDYAFLYYGKEFVLLTQYANHLTRRYYAKPPPRDRDGHSIENVLFVAP